MSGEWKDNAASRARVAAELAFITQEQAHHPKCTLCGQRAIRLDAWGLCSKVSGTHKDVRDGGRR